MKVPSANGAVCDVVSADKLFVQVPHPSELNPASVGAIATTWCELEKLFAMMSLSWPEKPDSLSQ